MGAPLCSKYWKSAYFDLFWMVCEFVSQFFGNWCHRHFMPERVQRNDQISSRIPWLPWLSWVIVPKKIGPSLGPTPNIPNPLCAKQRSQCYNGHTTEWGSQSQGFSHMLRMRFQDLPRNLDAAGIGESQFFSAKPSCTWINSRLCFCSQKMKAQSDPKSSKWSLKSSTELLSPQPIYQASVLRWPPPRQHSVTGVDTTTWLTTDTLQGLWVSTQKKDPSENISFSTLW